MLDTGPLWLIGLVLFLAMAVAWEGTYRFGRRNAESEADTAGGHVLSGVLGLLALLMAFAFSMAISRHDERRTLVVREANAFSTMHQRLALLGADAPPLDSLLAVYGEARVAAALASDPLAGERLFRAAEAIHAQLAKGVTAALMRSGADSRMTVIVPALNELGDIATERHAARAARLPKPVMMLLSLYCVIGAAMLGHTPSMGRERQRTTALVFLALTAIAYVTVLDIDRPRSGWITVPQAELESVVATLKRQAH